MKVRWSGCILLVPDPGRIFVDGYQPVRLQIDHHCFQRAEERYTHTGAQSKGKDGERRKSRLIPKETQHGNKASQKSNHADNTNARPQSFNRKLGKVVSESKRVIGDVPPVDPGESKRKATDMAG